MDEILLSIQKDYISNKVLVSYKHKQIASLRSEDNGPTEAEVLQFIEQLITTVLNELKESIK